MIKTSVARLAKRLQGTPKTALFGAATLIEFALLTLMVIDRVQILRQGTEVTLQTRPTDPRDFLRGDYVVLNYDIAIAGRSAPERTRRRTQPHRVCQARAQSRRLLRGVP